MVSMGLNYLLLWQEFVIEWNLWQECWIFPIQDYVNDLRDNLCCWFSLHVTSGHCSHLICMCTYHLHIIWAYVYYAHIICTSPSYVLSYRQCQCDLYVISTTLYRSYDVQLSFHTLFTQTHIVNAIYMLYAHIHIICYVSFTFLIYLITCNLVSAYCLHTHMSSAHHLYVICTATHGYHGPELSFTVTGICYWMEFVAGMLKCFISGSCKWFVR